MKNGFTLIELMMITVILGVLAGLSIMNFTRYKQKAFDGSTISDLTNLSRCQESYYLDHEAYGTCSNGDCETMLTGYRRSPNVEISTFPDAFGGFVIESSHPKGTTGLKCCYFSLGGGFAGCDTIASCLELVAG